MHRLAATPVPGLSPAQHGEGPTWDADRGELLWVDITAGQVRRAAIGDDGALTETGVHRGGDTVGAVVPASDGGWLLTADGGRIGPDLPGWALVETDANGTPTDRRIDPG